MNSKKRSSLRFFVGFVARSRVELSGILEAGTRTIKVRIVGCPVGVGSCNGAVILLPVCAACLWGRHKDARQE
jgi:hypothetical protein